MTTDTRPAGLPDLHNEEPKHALPLHHVGHQGVRRYVRVGDDVCAARIDIGIALSDSQRGAHMSRLIESLDTGSLRFKTLPDYAWHVSSELDRLFIDCAGINLAMTVDRLLPVDGGVKPVWEYLELSTATRAPRLMYGVDCRVCLACPQAQSIVLVDAGENLDPRHAATHNQVCDLSLRLQYRGLEDVSATPYELLQIAEGSASGPVRESHKRRSEADIVEVIHGRARFAEDALRSLVVDLADYAPNCVAVEASILNHESIFEYPLSSRIRVEVDRVRSGK